MDEPRQLSDSLEKLGIELQPLQIRQLEQFCRVLWSWNEKMNLTRHTDFETFATRDVADSCELAKLLDHGESVLDVGTGGGVPGVVLGILRPDLEVALSESVQKKAKALEAIVDQLNLPMAIHAARAETVLEDLRFDTLVARAVGPLWKICQWFQPHWDSMRRILLIKGPRWVEERHEAREKGLLRQLELRRVAAYPMAGTDSESVILQLWPKNRPTQRGQQATP
jgi:16S rRNA (guanine527-N7)-methyltransferase